MLGTNPVGSILSFMINQAAAARRPTAPVTPNYAGLNSIPGFNGQPIEPMTPGQYQQYQGAIQSALYPQPSAPTNNWTTMVPKIPSQIQNLNSMFNPIGGNNNGNALMGNSMFGGLGSFLPKAAPQSSPQGAAPAAGPISTSAGAANTFTNSNVNPSLLKMFAPMFGGGIFGAR